MTTVEARPKIISLVVDVIIGCALIAGGLWLLHKGLFPSPHPAPEWSPTQKILLNSRLGNTFITAIGAFTVLFVGRGLATKIKDFVIDRKPQIRISNAGLWCIECRGSEPIPWDIQEASLFTQRGSKMRRFSSRPNLMDRILGMTMLQIVLMNSPLHLRGRAPNDGTIFISLSGLNVPAKEIIGHLEEFITIEKG